MRFPCSREVLDEVAGLLRDPVRVTELGKNGPPAGAASSAGAPGQLDSPRVCVVDVASVVPHDEVAGEDELFPLPVQPLGASSWRIGQCYGIGWHRCQRDTPTLH